MAKERNTTRYTIRDGNRIEKFGITDRPEERAAEILRDGVPGEMRVEGPKVSRETALDWERGKIEAYLDRNGKLPPSNKVS